MPIEPLLSRLTKHRKSGQGRYMALCPSHEDKGMSLSLRELDDGRVLIHCFAGCDTGTILSDLDMQMTDLMPECIGDRRGVRRAFDAYGALEALTFHCTVLRQIAKSLREGKPLSEPDAAAAGRAERALQDALNACAGATPVT